MNAVRNQVDACWLDYLMKNKLQKKYFHEKENVVVRITLTPIIRADDKFVEEAAFTYC
jgi:hypothetical protein